MPMTQRAVPNPACCWGSITAQNVSVSPFPIVVSDFRARCTTMSDMACMSMNVSFAKSSKNIRPVGLVVGLPIHLSGDESEKSSEASKFAKWLTKVTGLPHTFQDERFSSFHAEKLLMAADCPQKNARSEWTSWLHRFCCRRFLTHASQGKRPSTHHVCRDDAKIVNRHSSANIGSSLHESQRSDEPCAAGF